VRERSGLLIVALPRRWLRPCFRCKVIKLRYISCKNFHISSALGFFFERLSGDLVNQEPKVAVVVVSVIGVDSGGGQ